MTMSKDNPMYAALQKGPVTIVAIAGDLRLEGWPKVVARPENWNMGHPVGALLEMSVDVSALAPRDRPEEGEVEPVAITLFELRCGKVTCDVKPPSPIVLEPFVENRLNRFLVVPRMMDDPRPDPA
jgi:hypothetical protein